MYDSLHSFTFTDSSKNAPIEKPKLDLSKKVTRYRAGKVPEYAKKAEEIETNDGNEDRLKNAKQDFKKERERFHAKIVAVSSKLEAKESDTSKRVERERVKEDHRSKEIKSALSDSESEDDNENEEFDQRRAALKAKLRQENKDDAVHDISNTLNEVKDRSAHSEEQITSASNESEEWETATESEEEQETLMKPMFVPKKARTTLSAQALIDREIEEEQKRNEKLMKRKEEAKKMVADEFQRSEAKNEDVTDPEMPDDTDGVAPEEEYKAWQIRELKRIKRNRDQMLRREMERKETERRRNLTAEEREAEDRELKKNEPKEKTKWKFLQKYYHKGAFYVDDDSVQSNKDVRRRDASGATLEDKFDKEILPKVMQVKNFGRAGRTKYTHLVDQDTTAKDSLWTKRDEIRAKYARQIGGVRDLDTQSNKKRKTG